MFHSFSIFSRAFPGSDRHGFSRQRHIHAQLVHRVPVLELPGLDEVLLRDTAKPGLFQRPGQQVPTLAGAIPTGTITVLVVVAAGDQCMIRELMP